MIKQTISWKEMQYCRIWLSLAPCITIYVDLALRYSYYILLKVIRFKQKIISAGLWHMKSSKCVIVQQIDLCMCVCVKFYGV